MMQYYQSPALGHLDRMSDSTGLIQHAIYSVPRRESGYTTDDNARALRLCARMLAHNPEDQRMLARVGCYLSFLEHARCPVRGFHNFLSYQRDWLDAAGTGDCQGQAVLALAEVLGSRLPTGFRALARELIDAVLPALAELRSLRAQAYVIQAWAHLSRFGVDDIGPLESVARLAADRLVVCYYRSKRPDWLWFESRMTYANAVMPHALFDAAERWPNEDYLSVAQSTFEFLDLVTTSDNVFWPVGNRDWFSHGEEKSLYDQQPIEAATMAAAALAGLALNHAPRAERPVESLAIPETNPHMLTRLTADDEPNVIRATHTSRDAKYYRIWQRACNWFVGHNSLGKSLVGDETGACFDGLQSHGVNQNQGAESTLAYLWTELGRHSVSSSTFPFPLHLSQTGDPQFDAARIN